MKLLCFQARRFAWRTFEKTLPDAPDRDVDESVSDAVVAFIHVEAADDAAGRATSVRRQALKHLKWLANKRGLKVIVLHSFTHLGGDSGAPEAANALLLELSERLTGSGYQTHITPFGYLHAWDIDVYGESLAKVWKEI